MLDIQDRVHFPSVNPILEGFEDTELAKVYNMADVYVSNSVAEGFGLPILEAQACGIPAIVPNNSSQTELVKGHGYVFESLPMDIYHEVPVYVPQLTRYPVPNQKHLLSALEFMYNEEEFRMKYGMKSREFAKQYDWKKIMPLWFKLLRKVESEINMLKFL